MMDEGVDPSSMDHGASFDGSRPSTIKALMVEGLDGCIYGS
jgi:hypothetical protein